MAQLEQELERVQRYGRSCSILFVDLDHFKSLNDGYGVNPNIIMAKIQQLFW